MDWVTREIITGIQKLSCLGLDREPAAELAEGTVAAWVEAVTLGKEWDERLDATRFRKAFTILAQTSSMWPTPKAFLEAMPARDQLALTKQAIPADPAKAEAAMDEIAQLLSTRRIP